MLEHDVTYNKFDNTFEIIKSKSSSIFKTIFIVVVTTVFIGFQLSFINKTEQSSLIIVPFAILAVVLITYAILQHLLKFKNIKIENNNNLIYINGKKLEMLKGSYLKVLNYDGKWQTYSFLYIIQKDKKLNLIYSSNPGDVKIIANELSDFLKIKQEQHYVSFPPIW